MEIDIKKISEALHRFPDEEKLEILRLLEEREKIAGIDDARAHFLPFVRKMWPIFISGRHHEIMAEAFERVASGKLKRLIINMPPRHTKSEFGSWLLPAWYMGKFPDRKIIQGSHTADLAVDFGRKTKNLIDSKEYQEIFPDVSLATDSKAAGRWNTNKGGTYFAVGVGGAMTGKGADLLIIDDPHSEQEAITAEGNPDIYHKTYSWYTSGPRQRLQPGGAIILIMTRWSKLDLTAQVLKKSAEMGGEQWEVIEFPAILNEGEEDEKALWPGFWKLEELKAVKAALRPSQWNAQYMQNPTSEEGALIKRDYWNKWESDKPPVVEAVIVSMDTAFEATERADYSACTTWGLFMHPDQSGKLVPNLILLDAWRAKLEFPELKATTLEHVKQWQPDMFIVEKKASGGALIPELRRGGISVTDFTPTRATGDKIVRINSITDIFRSGIIWAPEEPWAYEVVEECAAFPNGEHDDWVDCVYLAVKRFREGGLVIPTDIDDEPQERLPRKAPY